MATFIILLILLSEAASERSEGLFRVLPGEDAILNCDAGDAINVVQWTRDKLEPKYVLLVVDGHPDPAQQHPSFKGRVELVDNKLKNGNASLILKNVSSEDEGKYRCRVITAGPKRMKRAIIKVEPIKTIQLEVKDSLSDNDLTSDTPGNGNYPRRQVGLGVSFALCSAVVGLFLGWKYKRHSGKREEQSAAVEAVDLQLI